MEDRTELTAPLRHSLGNRYDERELDALVHAILDIEASSRSIIRIVDSWRDRREAAGDLVVDIGEEIAHIAYHARDAAAFQPFLDRGLATAGETGTSTPARPE